MNSNTDTSRPTLASATVALHARTSVEQVEEGRELAPKFDQDDLIACITTDADSGDVLMLGYMNHEALVKTVQTGEAYYWSRSRKTLWHKGATSGLVQVPYHAAARSRLRHFYCLRHCKKSGFLGLNPRHNGL